MILQQQLNFYEANGATTCWLTRCSAHFLKTCEKWGRPCHVIYKHVRLLCKYLSFCYGSWFSLCQTTQYYCLVLHYCIFFNTRTLDLQMGSFSAKRNTKTRWNLTSSQWWFAIFLPTLHILKLLGAKKPVSGPISEMLWKINSFKKKHMRIKHTYACFVKRIKQLCALPWV